jgi:integrase
VKPLNVTVRPMSAANSVGRTKPWGVFWKDAHGKKRSHYEPTEAAAHQFKADLELACRTATHQPVTEPSRRKGTVARFLTDWVEDHIKPKREAKTYEGYESIIRCHVIPAPMKDGRPFGNFPMGDLTPLVIERLYEDFYQRGYSLARRRSIHAVLSSACGRARKEGILQFNVCQDMGLEIRHRGEATQDPQPNPLTRDQAATFLAYVEANEPDWLEWFQLAHDAGPRPGELSALKWSRVDLGKHRAEIVASYCDLAKGDKDTKTHQNRWIDLSDLVVEQLTAWRTRQREQAFSRGLGSREYVFTYANGSPRRPEAARRVFHRVAEACRIGFVKNGKGIWVREIHHRPYDLRHTFATTHLSENYDRLPWVSRQLGHETTNTTVEHYFRFLPSTFSKQLANRIR